MSWMSLQDYDGEEIRVRAEVVLIIKPCGCGPGAAWIPCANPGKGSMVTLTGGSEMHCAEAVSEVEARVRTAQQ